MVATTTRNWGNGGRKNNSPWGRAVPLMNRRLCVCATCGAAIVRTPGRAARSKKQYCNPKCYQERK